VDLTGKIRKKRFRTQLYLEVLPVEKYETSQNSSWVALLRSIKGCNLKTFVALPGGRHLGTMCLEKGKRVMGVA